MTDTTPPPETGQLVSVRNRPAVVKNVKEASSQEGIHHLVNVDYLDGHDHPTEDQILWEVESRRGHLERAGWPDITNLEPDHPDHYQAYEDAVRWTSLESTQDLTHGDDELPLLAPWASAVQVEPYQLTPLLKAMNMPRVSLLLADDVGLGKTIQAGLITRELILRRRINRILIVVPASLQNQWKEEMTDKFHLDFTILDSDQARKTQREMGSDVNPWNVHNKIITSMDYLRQEVIYQQFEAAAKTRREEQGGAFSPWDLLIVDEAHHFAPKNPVDESLRTQMLRRLTEWFEHRLFLTATPHNGYTPSFTGLLELLDPVRFVQKQELTDIDRRHVDTVMERRLKREINQISTTQRFPEREVHGVPVTLTSAEQRLYDALRDYRKKGKQALGRLGRQKQNWGQFVFTLLNKRLLSSPYAFARTWWRHIGSEAFVDDRQIEDELRESISDAEEDIEDDIEKEDRERVAAEDGGSWVFSEVPDLKDEAENVSQALEALGWDEQTTAEGPQAGLDIPDAKIDALLQHIQDGFDDEDLHALLGAPDAMADDERLILFTEYKDTQDHILARLEQAGYAGNTVRAVYGGMSNRERDEIKDAFNDPNAEVRILVGTDAASEGLNLQHQCRYTSHYEIPWNPMKLEQRNGRVDRHGQARDVEIFHYTSDDDADQQFLSYVLQKVNDARHDLGSVGTVIDEGVQRHFWDGDVDQEDLEEWVNHVQEIDPAKEDLQEVNEPTREEFLNAKNRFEDATEAYDLDAETIRNVVESYLRFHNAKLEDAKRPGYRIRDARGKLNRFLQRNLAGEHQAMPRLVFDPKTYLHREDGREHYRPLPGTQLVRLAHPLTEASTSFFRRALWGQEDDVNRWTMLGYEPSTGEEAYVKLTYLLTGRNQLQETIHTQMDHWWFHLTPGGIHRLADEPTLRNVHTIPEDTMRDWWTRLRPAFVDYADQLEPLAEKAQHQMREVITARLDKAGTTAREDVKEQFDERIGDLRQEMRKDARQRLEAKLEAARQEAQQLRLDPRLNLELERRVEHLEKRLSDEDLAVFEQNQKLMIQRLEDERERYLDEVLPRRYSLADPVEVVQVGATMYVPNGGEP